MKREYTISEMKSLIQEKVESKNEFKPVFGKHVPEDNKEINGKAYKDIAKETEAYDGGLGADKKNKKSESIMSSSNYGMSDLRYDSISKPFKDRTKAQMKGYVSADAEKQHKNEKLGNAFYSSDSMIKDIESRAKDLKSKKDSGKTDGLTSKEHKDEIEKNSETMFENRKINRIAFKHTQFLSEGHMLSKVPDEFKVEGKTFIMKDSSNNEYLVEWTADKPNVTKRLNKTVVNEEMNRIKALYNYKSKDYFNSTTPKSRVNENKEFSDVLGRARQLMR